MRRTCRSPATSRTVRRLTRVGCQAIRLAGEVAGLVGGSIEDSTAVPEADLRLRARRGEMVAAAEAARALPFPFILVGRVEKLTPRPTGPERHDPPPAGL